MEKNAVGWFEIYVQDLPRARAFYEAVLGQKLQKIEAGGLEMWAFPWKQGATGASGALVKMQGVPSGGNSTLVYFMCDDTAVEEGRVAKAGGKVFKPKFAIGEHGFVSLVYDSEGNLFGLHSMK